MTQKELYTKLWETEYIPSACAIPLASYITRIAKKDDLLLDIGCGDGTTVRLLREAGFNAYGLDLTLAGIKVPESFFFEASITERSLIKDDAFDFTFSTDCLEHLPPEEVVPAIEEILRITKRQTFHCIPISGDMHLGIDVHPSKHDAEWWLRKFAQANLKRIDVTIKEREQFLQEVRCGH
jgi:SAM-dependent methyltransferase